MGWKDDAAVPLSPENAEKILEMLEGGRGSQLQLIEREERRKEGREAG